MLGLSLDQAAHAHGDKLDILPVAIANINIVNIPNIVQNYIVFSNAKQSGNKTAHRQDNSPTRFLKTVHRQI